MSASLIIRPEALFWSRFQDDQVNESMIFEADCHPDYDITVLNGYGTKAVSGHSNLDADELALKVKVKVVCTDELSCRNVTWLEDDGKFQLIFTIEIPHRQFDMLSRWYGNPDNLFRLNLTIEGDAVQLTGYDGSSTVYTFDRRHWSEAIKIVSWQLDVGNKLIVQRQS